MDALRQAQAVERECARSVVRSEKAAELLANLIMEQLGQAGPPTAREFACKRSKAVDPSSSCKQEGGPVFNNMHGRYYPPAPACHDIPIQPLQDFQRCAFARHIPFSSSIVGRQLGSKVAALVTCWACGDKLMSKENVLLSGEKLAGRSQDLIWRAHRCRVIGRERNHP